MDKQWFDSLPALYRNRKYTFEEVHAIACPSPRPVAVKVSSGYKQLPIDLWPVAEFLVAALQGEEVFEREACNVEAFLLQLLSKAVVAANVLGSTSCLGHNGLLSLFAARAKPSATVAELRETKELPMNAKSSSDVSDVILDTKETCVFSEAKAAPVQEPEKVKANGPADASVLQVAQISLEVCSDGQACVSLSEEQNAAAEGQDERLVCSKPAAAAAAAGAEPKEEEASEEVKITLRAEPSVQETAKQRRRRKRRERLRQNAVA
jgi:hypothetical protein